MSSDWKNGGFGIYIHWPFCLAKCPYCDFNSFVDDDIDHSRWQRAYLTELDRAAEQVPDRVVNSIYFGGGTPSLMSPDTVATIVEKIRSIWHLSNNLEVTLEANPTSVEADRFLAYRGSSVNRLSLGIQSLNDASLRKLGRVHTAKEALSALELANSVFDRTSFDLIYARQDQTLSDWQKELSEALSYSTGHISLYQLTVEEGTAFGDRQKVGKLSGLPRDEMAADMYAATAEICNAAGLQNYEISNYAAPGDESRHNLLYWRYGDFLGIGPGAHGRITIGDARFATETELSPGKWLSDVKSGKGYSLKSPLSGQTQAEEYLMMSLRLNEGTDMSRFQDLSGSLIDSRKIKYLSEMNLVSTAQERLTATSSGRLVLNSVLKELLAD